MTNALFNSDNSDNELSNELESLKTRFVKEDGTLDVDGLLTAKAHADRHIKRIETEQAGLREDLKVRATLEDIAARIEAQKNTPVITEQQNNTPSEPRSEIDIDKLVDSKLTAIETRRLYAQNVELVKNELSKAWGPDFSAKLNAKARELGETPDSLGLIAETKPKLFLQLMGVSANTNSNYAPPPSSQIRNQPGRTNGKTYADFQKLRRENPSQYWSVATQKELHKLAEEYTARGEDFTKTK